MRYTYVRQHDTTDCAAACLAMVCLHYKKEVTITRLRDMMGTDLKGTNLVGLQKAANELGFTTAAVRVDRENFLSDFSLPCIAQVITDQGLAHFVVVFKKTTIKDDGARRSLSDLSGAVVLPQGLDALHGGVDHKREDRQPHQCDHQQ